MRNTLDTVVTSEQDTESSTKRKRRPSDRILLQNMISQINSASRCDNPEDEPQSPILKPSDNDVICRKGNLSFYHKGNQRLQRIVNAHVDQYKAAQTKTGKSLVVSLVLSLVRGENGQGGRFVRQDSARGTWEEATTRFAREKIGQLFRNALHTDYKSSVEAKRQRREDRAIQRVTYLTEIVEQKPFVKAEMNLLSMHLSHSRLSDDEVEKLFMESNCRILAGLKESNAAAQLSSMLG